MHKNLQGDLKTEVNNEWMTTRTGLTVYIVLKYLQASVRFITSSGAKVTLTFDLKSEGIFLWPTFVTNMMSAGWTLLELPCQTIPVIFSLWSWPLTWWPKHLQVSPSDHCPLTYWIRIVNAVVMSHNPTVNICCDDLLTSKSLVSSSDQCPLTYWIWNL